jgi:hypothetical protein
MILLMVAKYGPSLLVCMSNRMNRVLLVSGYNTSKISSPTTWITLMIQDNATNTTHQSFCGYQQQVQ